MVLRSHSVHFSSESRRVHDMLALCPICSGECESGEESCPACGCGLVPSTIEAGFDHKAAVGEAGERFVELCRPRMFPFAMLIKQTLEQNEVEVMVKGAHSMSVLPQLAFSGELRVMVRERQLNFARQLYVAYFENDGDTEYPDEE